MIPTRVFAIVLLGGMASLAAGAASATVSLSGSTFLQATSQVGDAAPNGEANMDSWIGARRELSVAADALARGGLDSVETRGAIDAVWASADAGTVNLSGFGWTVNADDPDIHALAGDQSSDGTTNWTYQFTATANGTFSLTAIDSAEGVTRAGLGDWRIAMSERGGPTARADILSGFGTGAQDDTINGAFSQALIAGHTYTVSLSNLDGFSTVGNTTGAGENNSENMLINWRISSDEVAGGVPEPASWALMITGFGLAGASLRARRRALA